MSWDWQLIVTYLRNLEENLFSGDWKMFLVLHPETSHFIFLFCFLLLLLFFKIRNGRVLSVGTFLQRSDSNLFADLCSMQLWAFLCTLCARMLVLCSELPAFPAAGCRRWLGASSAPSSCSHRCSAYLHPLDLSGSFQILLKLVHS